MIAFRKVSFEKTVCFQMYESDVQIPYGKHDPLCAWCHDFIERPRDGFVCDECDLMVHSGSCDARDLRNEPDYIGCICQDCRYGDL